MSKQEGLCNIPVLSETSLRKLSEGKENPLHFCQFVFLSIKETNYETKKNVFTPKSLEVLEKINI